MAIAVLPHPSLCKIPLCITFYFVMKNLSNIVGNCGLMLSLLNRHMNFVVF